MIWHNEEAEELAVRVAKIIHVWNQGAICPSEFLAQLEDAVTEARAAKNARAEKTSGESSS